MSRKLALIIGNSDYEDGNLARLVNPDADVRALAEILRDPVIGGFDEVEAIVNQPSTTVRRAIAGFFAGRGRDDLLLLYFSGHGIRDDRGQLFLAVKDTEHNLLRGTAIPAAFVTEEMDNSRSRRQVLILDCCHSGAFSQGMKAAPGGSVGTAAVFEGTGSGRVVLTATDSTQYAWEGDQVIGQAENSVFTHHLIQGLRTGKADADMDGRITLDELYNFVYEQVIDETPLQTPGKWSYGQRGEIVIARNPNPVIKPVELPPDLQQTIDDPRPWVREGAVKELDRILQGNNPGLALTAYTALKRLADDDSRRVASLAAQSLATHGVEAREEPSVSTEGAKQEVSPRMPAPEKPESRVVDQAEAAPILREKQAQEKPAVGVGGPGQPVQERTAHDGKATERGKQDTEGVKFIGAIIPQEMIAPIWITILSWAILSAIGWVISEMSGWQGNAYENVWALVGITGGLMTGLAIRRGEPSIQWKHIALITAGWAVGMALGGVVSVALYQNEDAAINGTVRGIIGGLVTGSAIKWAVPSMRWNQVLIITVGWTIGLTISQGIGPGLYNAFNGAISGLSGNPVKNLGVLAESLNPVFASAMIMPHGLGAFVASVPWNARGDILSSILVVTNPATVLLYAIPGAINGAIASGIGCGIMFWQLGLANRSPGVTRRLD